VPSGAQLPQRLLVSFSRTLLAPRPSAAACRATSAAIRSIACSCSKAPTRAATSSPPPSRIAPGSSQASPMRSSTMRTTCAAPPTGTSAPAWKTTGGASAASLSRTQAAWVFSNATPAGRPARGGKVTTTEPLRTSIRRLTRLARAERRHCTGPGKPASCPKHSSPWSIGPPCAASGPQFNPATPSAPSRRRRAARCRH
jgi:hypothetical protein